MKLLVQIPCYNEAKTIATVISLVPRRIEGITAVEIVVVDDGSSDGSENAARMAGADHVVRSSRNLGLAHTFRRGIDSCLALGADVIVNLDGDNQYDARDIPVLIAPILRQEADIVVGDRKTDFIPHFSPVKKWLQRLGSATVRELSHTDVQDVTSGFRALSRDAAFKLTILSNYTYTLESILQASTKGFKIVNVAVRTNGPTRRSRLMKNIGSYILFSVATILRVFAMYNPLRVFIGTGAICVGLGSVLVLRFLILSLSDGGHGHVQSLIAAAILILSGMGIMLAGLLADLIQFNRRLLEDILERVKRVQYDNRRL